LRHREIFGECMAANANEFGHVRRVDSILGLFIPQIVTPLELMGAEDEAELF
jgi:hypothetical protein